MVERLIPAYWLERLGCAENTQPLKVVLERIQKKIAPIGGRISCRSFHEPSPFCMLILTFNREAPDEHCLRMCIHPDQDPDFYIDSQLYDAGKLEEIVKFCDRTLLSFVRKHVRFVEAKNIAREKKVSRRKAATSAKR